MHHHALWPTDRAGYVTHHVSCCRRDISVDESESKWTSLLDKETEFFGEVKSKIDARMVADLHECKTDLEQQLESVCAERDALAEEAENRIYKFWQKVHNEKDACEKQHCEAMEALKLQLAETQSEAAGVQISAQAALDALKNLLVTESKTIADTLQRENQETLRAMQRRHTEKLQQSNSALELLKQEHTTALEKLEKDSTQLLHNYTEACSERDLLVERLSAAKQSEATQEKTLEDLRLQVSYLEKELCSKEMELTSMQVRRACAADKDLADEWIRVTSQEQVETVLSPDHEVTSPHTPQPEECHHALVDLQEAQDSLEEELTQKNARLRNLEHEVTVKRNQIYLLQDTLAKTPGHSHAEPVRKRLSDDMPGTPRVVRRSSGHGPDWQEMEDMGPILKRKSMRERQSFLFSRLHNKFSFGLKKRVSGSKRFSRAHDSRMSMASIVTLTDWGTPSVGRPSITSVASPKATPTSPAVSVASTHFSLLRCSPDSKSRMTLPYEGTPSPDVEKCTLVDMHPLSPAAENEKTVVFNRFLVPSHWSAPVLDSFAACALFQ
eukprot:gene2776-553_t